jgi:hypothetical protein
MRLKRIRLTITPQQIALHAKIAAARKSSPAKTYIVVDAFDAVNNDQVMSEMFRAPDLSLMRHSIWRK